MASMNDIKHRKESITSTGQITKAMKLVSTVRLQKAKQTAEDSREYFVSMYDTVTNLLSKIKNVSHPFISGGNSEKKAVIVLSSNRGLAGGYNGNVIKEFIKQDFNKENTLIFTIGQKGKEALIHNGYNVYKDYGEIGEAPEYLNAKRVCDEIISLYKDGEIGEIYIAYTLFKNTVVHIPTFQKILPITPSDIANREDGEKKKNENTLMSFEMDDSEALELLVPKYITSMIYGAMLQSVASENGARMQAMDSATSNAEEMIENLTLLYNRARQSSITQELTEIIAGADAIG